MSRTVSMSSTIHSISFSTKPREVTAGVPMRRPEVENGVRESNGTMFLFTVMSALPSSFSATLPVRKFSAQIDEHQMVVSTARDDLVAAPDEGVTHCGGIGEHLLLIVHELRLLRLKEGYCLRGDTVLKRTALNSGEYRGIYDL